MSLDLIKTWNDMEDIIKTLNKRKEVLLTLDRKRFLLLDQHSIFGAGGTLLSTDFELPLIFDGDYHETIITGLPFNPPQPHLSSLIPGAIIYIYKGYTVDFFGVDSGIIDKIDAEIVVAGGPGVNKPLTPEFWLRRPDKESNQYESFTTYANDPTHITFTKSFFSIVATALFNARSAYGSNEPEGHQVMYMRLLLNFNNLRRFA